MKIGVNLTSSHSISIASKLLKMQSIDFCELLIDNFITYDPYMILDKIGSTPVSFHIMRSRFMERNTKDLKELSSRVKHWIDILRPIYVSDHIAKFSVNGRSLIFLGEMNYKNDYKKVKIGVQKWQELLGTKVYFENFPSFIDYDANQIDFLKMLRNETSCGILFDFSNAVIASKNSKYLVNRWLNTASSAKHFHVAGFCTSNTDPNLWIDSHDCELSRGTVDFFTRFLKTIDTSVDKTIVIERDAKIELNSWLSDIKKIKNKLIQEEMTCLI